MNTNVNSRDTTAERILQCDARFFAHLRRRTALAGAFIFLIPFGFFYILANYASERYVRGQIYTRLQASAATNTRLFDDVLSVRVAETESLARALSQASPSPAKGAAVLREFVHGNPWYGMVVVADSSGQIVFASEDLRGNIRDWDSFERALAGETPVSDLFLSPLTRKSEMAVMAPLATTGGRATRVLVAALKLDKLSSRLLDPGLGLPAETFLVNQAGQFASPTLSGGRVLAHRAFDAGSANPFQGVAGIREYRDFRGRVVLCAYRKLSGKGYHLVAQAAWTDVLPQVQALRQTVLLYVLPFLALGVVLAVLAWRYAMDYIEKLTRELYEALQVAQDRERERDTALQALARRLEEERELAKEKAQFQAQLAEFEKYAALAQLALGAAHEINNPLLGILSHLELQLRGTTGEEERTEIQQCIEGAKRISSTVRGLLNYARPGPLQLSKVNLDRIVSDTLAFLCHQPMFHGIKLEKDIPPDAPAISADANQISQVLMNLLLNAAEAMPEGGTITISAEKVKFADKVEIRVTDTGCGIAADILPRVLEPFFTTKRGKGTGLGLSISQAYVRSHGGDLQVESIPQRGTTVRITLPVRQEGRPVPETAEVIT